MGRVLVSGWGWGFTAGLAWHQCGFVYLEGGLPPGPPLRLLAASGVPVLILSPPLSTNIISSPLTVSEPLLVPGLDSALGTRDAQVWLCLRGAHQQSWRCLREQ